MTKAILLLFVFASLSFAGNTREFLSPDKKFKVIIENFNDSETNLESKIRVVNSQGKLLVTHKYTSTDGEHGYCVIQAEWTSDSRFFIFCMVSSGGHQPWHIPTSVYSITDNKIFSIDDIYGPVTAASFRIVSSDSLETSILTGDDHTGETIVIPLTTLSSESR